jgi:succinate dehydrogenase/fumarate reductase cytochrome b subunit
MTAGKIQAGAFAVPLVGQVDVTS